MQQSQKTSIELDRRETGKNLEGLGTTGMRSTVSGEDKMQDGVSFQDKVLSRKNLNEAYMQEHRKEFVESLRRETYKPAPVKRVESLNRMVRCGN